MFDDFPLMSCAEDAFPSLPNVIEFNQYNIFVLYNICGGDLSSV